jgi:hypothetical protein
MCILCRQQANVSLCNFLDKPFDLYFCEIKKEAQERYYSLKNEKK